MKNLAIIPARGGSKRINLKNIKDFLGKPVISYSIEAAISCSLFDEIMVSTDDIRISECAKFYGAKVPFMRSKENSDDFATLSDVVCEVIEQYESMGQHFDQICCILPTAPLIESRQITNGLHKLTNESFDSVSSIFQLSYPTLRALEFTSDNKLKMIWPEYLNIRSQDLKLTYHDAGTFYWIKTAAFMKEKTLIAQNGSAIILSEMEVQDIDTEMDWKLAELKYKLLHE